MFVCALQVLQARVCVLYTINSCFIRFRSSLQVGGTAAACCAGLQRLMTIHMHHKAKAGRWTGSEFPRHMGGCPIPCGYFLCRTSTSNMQLGYLCW